MSLPLAKKEVIAAFDFDGTITYCDTLMPFLLHLSGSLKWLGKMILLSPLFIGFLLRLYSRQEVKEKVLTCFIKGMHIDQLQDAGHAFALGWLQQLVRPEALKRLHWHQKQGHRCILISASLDIYLSPWADQAGFHDLICSSLEEDSSGIVTGKLFGENCRGPEKTRRLSDLLGPLNQYVIYAYGDSKGDKELLAAADFAYYRKMPVE